MRGESLHPSVPATYCALALVALCLSFSPFLLLIAVIALICWRLSEKPSLLLHAGNMSLIFIIVFTIVLNCLFSKGASTTLIQLGNFSISLEGVVYGACMGIMLASMMLLFECASTEITSDDVMTLSGKRLPSLALVASMVLRQVPSYERRSRDMRAAICACTANRAEVLSRIREYGREISALTSYSLEESLIRAQSMKARNFTNANRRTFYKRQRFAHRDLVFLLIVVVLGVLAIFCATDVSSHTEFYPQIEITAPLYDYLPYTAFMVLPVLLSVIARKR